MCSADPRECIVNHEVTAAVDVLNASRPAGVTADDVAAPDAIVQLGTALEDFSTRVARREHELNRIFDQIAVERSSLLDAVLSRVVHGFSRVIPFDALECAFLSDDGTTLVSYWSRGVAGDAVQPGHVTSIEGSRLRQSLGDGRAIVVNDLLTHAMGQSRADLERRLIRDGARALLACPLVADGVPLGFLFFTSRRARVFSDAHAAAFQQAAGQVSVVVQKTRAYGEVVNHNRVLLRETRRLHEVATTDALTGVMNRRALDVALTSAWERHTRDRAGFGVIFCDVDHFKHVNDTHGHSVGDRVLARTAMCLMRGLRGGDIFGRFGGEEFLAIVDTGSETTLADVAQRLRAMVAREMPCGISVTASFGAAAAPRFSSLAALLAAADRALYMAKAHGRNQCVMATESALPDAPVIASIIAPAAARVERP